MPRPTALLNILLLCTLAWPCLPLAAEAADSADLVLAAEAGPLLAALAERERGNLLDRLLAQQVSYELDPAAALKFSCNVAALTTGLDLGGGQEAEPATTPELQIQLVVKF